MNVIILVALIFVILSLANKYLKVPMDNNQRYDGINNRFYGEGHTGDMPMPPSDDEDREDGQEDGREVDQGDSWEDGEEDQEDRQRGQADNGTEFGADETGADVQDEYGPGEAGTADRLEYGAEDQQASGRNEIPVRQDEQPDHNMVNHMEDRQPDSLWVGGSDQKAPAGDAAIYSNTDNEQGVVIDTEVHIDAAMPQDPEKS